MNAIRLTIITILLAIGWNAPACGQERPKGDEPGPTLRILLFAGGPSREFQFLRHSLMRDPRKVELSICLQTADEGSDLGVAPERALKEFPLLDAKKVRDYDVVIALDADWGTPSVKHLQALEKWVNEQAGGLILVAGPINSWRLARPGGRDLTALTGMLPVRLKDTRVHAVLDPKRDPGLPYVLRLADDKSPLLFLDSTDTSASVGWDQYFWNGPAPKGGKKAPKRGFFNLMPVEPLNARAQVLASLVDHKGGEHPFLVTSEHGKGKVVFVASEELWRLRICRMAYHEHLWWNLAQYAVGRRNLPPSSALAVQRQAVEGETIPVEVRLLDDKGKPLGATVKPILRVRSPDGKQNETAIALKPREGAPWAGLFDASIPVPTAGDYALSVEVPGVKISVTAKVKVKSLFEAYVQDGEMLTRQTNLARRCNEWSLATFALARRMSDKKLAKPFRDEAQLYQDAIESTIAKGWTIRHQKMIRSLTALKAGKMTDLRAALEESEALGEQLQAMRARLLGPDHVKQAKESTALLRKLTEEETQFEIILVMTRTSLIQADNRLQFLMNKFSLKEQPREEWKEAAGSIEEMHKNLGNSRVLMQGANQRCQKALQDVKASKIRPETMRFLEAQCGPLDQFLEQDFARAAETVGAVHEMFKKNEYDHALVKKAMTQIAMLQTTCDGVGGTRIGSLFAELAQLEAEQAQQTRILTEIRKHLEAELLKQLLDGKQPN